MAISSTLPAWFADGVAALKAGDIDGWMALYAADAVHEFPFAPEGGVQRLEGRGTIAAYMRQIPARIRFGSLSDVRVRETDKELIVEARGHHHRVADGSPRELDYVWFITRRDGLITHFRDYMNAGQLAKL